MAYGKHYEWIYYEDYGEANTVAKICSDSRVGMNLSSLIDKVMFWVMCDKICHA